MLGGLIGALMGIGAGFWWGDIVMLSIQLATALVLLPMMSGIVMQALVPVSEAAAEFMQARTKGKQLFTDYLALYRFDDGWKIVAKTFFGHP